MFRGKESPNRIELSRLVQDLLNFGVSGSLQLWGVGGGWMGVGDGWGWVGDGWGWVWDGSGAPHTCMHMHAHIHVKHDNFNCKWQPPLGESPMMSYVCARACTCVHVHACACVWGGTLSPPPPPFTHPPTPKGGTPGISQNSIALELIKIFQFCLKI